MGSLKRAFATVTLESLSKHPAEELGPLEMLAMKMKLEDAYDSLELEVVNLEEAEKGLVTVVYHGSKVTLPRQCVTLSLRHELA